jgi:hypothetical protein
MRFAKVTRFDRQNIPVSSGEPGLLTILNMQLEVILGRIHLIHRKSETFMVH